MVLVPNTFYWSCHFLLSCLIPFSFLSGTTWFLMMNRPAMQSSNVSILSSCIYLLLPWIEPVFAQLKNKLINSLTQIQFLTSSGPPPRTDDTDHLEYSLLTAIELVGTWSHRHSERQIVARVASSRDHCLDLQMLKFWTCLLIFIFNNALFYKIIGHEYG